MLDIAARRMDFHALHEDGYFLLPTAWDVGSAKRLEGMGFAGFATSIPCLGWTLGRADVQVTRDEVLAGLQQLVDATEIAVEADFGSGFAEDEAGLMANVRLAIDTGIDALSLKDQVAGELDDLEHTIARIRIARQAIDMSGAEVLLVARSEGLLIGQASADDTIERLVACAQAGADVVCAPGLSEPAKITALVKAVAPKAVDIRLMRPGVTAVDLGELGVRRISVGDALAQASWAAFTRTAQQFIDYGDLLPDSDPAM